MATYASTISPGCPTAEISAYIDGELDPARELEMECHFAACPECIAELNLQKRFLCDLNSSLKNQQIELPADFTKQIVTNAESTVAGLRRPTERFNAVFICAAILLFVLFATGAEAGTVAAKFYSFFERIAMVGGMLGHLVYSLVLGVVIVVRTFAGKVPFDAAGIMGLAMVFCMAIMLISRRFSHVRKA